MLTRSRPKPLASDGRRAESGRSRSCSWSTDQWGEASRSREKNNRPRWKNEERHESRDRHLFDEPPSLCAAISHPPLAPLCPDWCVLLFGIILTGRSPGLSCNVAPENTDEARVYGRRCHPLPPLVMFNHRCLRFWPL